MVRTKTKRSLKKRRDTRKRLLEKKAAAQRRLRYSKDEREKRKVNKYRQQVRNVVILLLSGGGVSAAYLIALPYLQQLQLHLPYTITNLAIAILLLIVIILSAWRFSRAFGQYARYVEKETAKRTEQTIGRYKALIQNAQDIISILDKHGKILYQSPSTKRILGYEPADLEGTSIMELVHPDDRALMMNALSQKSTFFFSFRLQHYDGRWLWFEAIGSNQSHNPLIKGILLNMRDITDRKREEELKRQKEIAALKTAMEKERVEREKRIIEEGKRKLEEAYAIIEEKNREIMDSITYAFRIQSAIVPNFEELKKIFPDAFLFWRPRDIVSGDFYFFYHNGRYTCMTAADCTGHGVPGAFMTMIGTVFLRQIVMQEGIFMPNEILTRLHHYVQKALKQDQPGAETKDGMDISLMTYDHEKKVLYWAGAYNPLVIGRNGEFIEIKADKKPIGGAPLPDEKERTFTLHTIEPQPGDMFYSYSDGFQDQFGGPRGRKFMTKKFKKLLGAIASMPAEEQEKKLGEVLDEWTQHGKYPQVDDIIILGVRIIPS